MKCPQYEPAKDGQCYCDLGAYCTYESRRDDCRNGFVPYWTEPERAGLKAMGQALRVYQPRKSYLDRTDYTELSAGLKAQAGAIRAFVAAARKAKGE